MTSEDLQRVFHVDSHDKGKFFLSKILSMIIELIASCHTNSTSVRGDQFSVCRPTKCHRRSRDTPCRLIGIRHQVNCLLPMVTRQSEIIRPLNGRRYQLQLQRNQHLIKGGKDVRVWVADSPSANSSTPFGDITLEELPQVRASGIYLKIRAQSTIDRFSESARLLS